MTLLEHLQELPEPYRDLAIATCHANGCGGYPAKGQLYESLQAAFIWDNTPEGFDYWNGLCKELKGEGK